MADLKDTNVTAPEVDVDVGSAKDVEEIMKKYDRESNTRIYEGVPKTVIHYLLAAFSLFMMWMNLFATWGEQFRRPLFLGCIVVFVFLLFPARKGHPGKVNRIPWYDIILMVAGAGSFFYFVVNNQSIIGRATRISELEIILGVIGILVLGECCRRVVGIPILCVSGCFIIYAFVAGKTLKAIIYNLFYTTTGVIGTPIGVCSTFIVLFVIFGSFLEATGISDFFIACANRIAGWASGGPAKVAVISSALCGMVSGSSVGNTVTTGSVTIPMMKKTGYPGEFAGAVEAAASTGGQIMPPIMGAAAFLMAEMIGVEYKDVVIRAILPAFLYFSGIFLMVHFRAKRLGLKGIAWEELPKVRTLLPRIYLLAPLVVLVWMIISGKTMARSAIISTGLCIAVALVPYLLRGMSKVTSGSVSAGFKEVSEECHAMDVDTFFTALANGAQNCLSIAVACGIAGIIAGVVTMTGLGQIFISAIVGVAGNKLIIALLLTMVTCIILGMGVPTTANYVIMATTCAPILTTGMGMSAMAANMFVFYFGIVADITPPVALAAYAGSAIAKSRPMKTALNATRLAIAAFLVPYIFALNPAMLFIDTVWYEVVLIVLSSFIGMIAISVALEGYLLRPVHPILRILCAAGGLALLVPGTLTDLFGLVALVITAVCQVIAHRQHKAATE
ncbi:MAG: TRAP transporter permease [Candidatus Onthomonas sp.]|nr:TRAP transporter permease [Candidatus Onthomonas sp.]